MRTEITVDVAIIGAGTAGLYALRVGAGDSDTLFQWF